MYSFADYFGLFDIIGLLLVYTIFDVVFASLASRSSLFNHSNLSDFSEICMYKIFDSRNMFYCRIFLSIQFAVTELSS